MVYEQRSKRRLSRRQVLRSGAVALGGTGALLAGATAAAQSQGPFDVAQGGPAVLTGTQAGGRSAGSSATPPRSTSRSCGSCRWIRARW